MQSFFCAILTAVAVKGGLFGSVAAQPSKADPIAWETSLQRAQDAAFVQNKKLLVYLWTEWSGLCRVLENNALRDPRVVQLIRDEYIPVAMKGDAREDLWFQGEKYAYIEEDLIHGLAYILMNGKTEFPTLVVMNRHGQVLSPIVGLTPPDRLAKILKYYASGIYITNTWEEFENAYHPH
jgi:thioredoxin-related protein